MIKVLIATEHSLVRLRLRQALDETGDIVATAEATNGKEVLTEVAKRDFDVILLDISISDGRGLEILHQLHHDKPHLPILILSDYCEEQYVIKVLTEGACGYLAKGSVSEELIPALRQVAAGKRFITAVLPRKWTSDSEPPHEKRRKP